MRELEAAKAPDEVSTEPSHSPPASPALSGQHSLALALAPQSSGATTDDGSRSPYFSKPGEGTGLLSNTPAEGGLYVGAFLDSVETALRAAIEPHAQKQGQSAADCPLLRYALKHYRSRSAADVEGSARRALRADVAVRTPEELLGQVLFRLTEATDHWASTGSFAKVPRIVLADLLRDDGAAWASSMGLGSWLQLKSADDEGPNRSPSPAAVLSELGEGQPLPAETRGRFEGAFGGLSLSSVRLHDDAHAAHLADDLRARAFTVGDHIALGSDAHPPGTPAGDALMAHELAHTVQQRGAPSGGPGVGAQAQHQAAHGRAQSSLEHEADRAAAQATAALWGDHPRKVDTVETGGGLRLSRCSNSGLSEKEQVKIWQSQLNKQFTGDIDKLPATFDSSLLSPEVTAGKLRGKVLDAKMIPSPLLSAWDAASRRVIEVGPVLRSGGVPPAPVASSLRSELTAFYDAFRAQVSSYDVEVQHGGTRAVVNYVETTNRYLAPGTLDGVMFPLGADHDGARKRLAAAATRDDWLRVVTDFRFISNGFDRFVGDLLRQQQKTAVSGSLDQLAAAADTANSAWKGASPRTAELRNVAKLSMLVYARRLRESVAHLDYQREVKPLAVKSTSPYLETTNDFLRGDDFKSFSFAADAATNDGDFERLIARYETIKAGKAAFIASGAKAKSEEADALEYQGNVGRAVANLRDRYPEAQRIPAVFYPKSESAGIQSDEFTAHGIPLQLYMVQEGKSWRLYDLTNPEVTKDNVADAPDLNSAAMKLFPALDSRLRFPKGKLYFRLPDNSQFSITTTASWSVSDWLSAFAIGAAALGLAFASGGASVPATCLFIGSGVLGAAASFMGMVEKSQHGMLQTVDILVGVTSIAAELANAVTVGMGKLVVSGTKAAGLLGRVAALVSPHYAATTKLTLVANSVSLIAIGAKELQQLEAIEKGPGSADEKRFARERLVNHLLLMGGISLLAIRGNIEDFRNARTLVFDAEFAAEGMARRVLKDEELLALARASNVEEEVKALLIRPDVSAEARDKLRLELSDALSTVSRDPAALKKQLGDAAHATGDAVKGVTDALIGQVRKGNQENYARLVALAEREEFKALLKSKPHLREVLERNPALVDLLANEKIFADVILKNPKALESLGEHPEAVGLLLDAFGRVKAKNVVATTPSATPLTAQQLKLSGEVSSAASTKKAIQPGFDGSKTGDSKYVTTYVDGIYADAAAAQTKLSSLAEEIAGSTGGTAVSRPGPKDRARVNEKLNEYGNDASRLVDLAGSKVVYRTLEDLYKGLFSVRSKLGGNIVKFKDRFIKPESSGYRDVLMSVRIEIGPGKSHVAELRLHLESIDAFAGLEHATYEVKRSLQDMALLRGKASGASGAALKEPKNFMTADELALFNALDTLTQTQFEKALKEALPKAP